MLRPLGVILAICLGALQLLAVLGVVFSFYLSTEAALVDNARQLLRQAAGSAAAQTRQLLQSAEDAGRVVAGLVARDLVDVSRPDLLAQLFQQEMHGNPTLRGFSWGSTTGDLLVVERGQGPDAPGHVLQAGFAGTSGAAASREAAVGAQIADAQAAPLGDPRARDWYQRAVAAGAGGTVWMTPSLNPEDARPGIRLAVAVQGANGVLRGVIAADIDLAPLSEALLHALPAGHGQVLLIAGDGAVLAHSSAGVATESSAAHGVAGQTRLRRISELEDPVARQGLAPLLRMGRMEMPAVDDWVVALRSGRQLLAVTSLDSPELPWVVAVHAPEHDFTGELNETLIEAMWVALVLTLATAAAGLGLAMWLSRPLRAFAVRDALVSQGEIDPGAPAPRSYQALDRANAELVAQIAARRASDHQYGQTFERASRGLAQLSVDGLRILRANRRFCDILGHAPGTLDGHELGRLIHPHDLSLFLDRSGAQLPADLVDASPTLSRLDARMIPADGQQSLSLRLINREGAVVWIQLHGVLIRTRSGEPLYVLLTIDDISADKTREARIVELSRELQHLARGHSLGQMASGLAHELNQPLTAIAQNADTGLLLLKRQKDAHPDLLEILEEMASESMRAGEMIHALRGFVRKDDARRTRFDLADLVDQSIPLVQSEANEAGIEILRDIAPDMPEVLAVRIQVAQVLINLLRNAVEAIQGAQKLAPGDPRQGRIEIAAWAQAGVLHVAVRDNGPGVSPSIALFGQFETTKPEGMGLGLSICRQMIRDSGGNLWHQPRAGGGAIFRFTLPFATVSAFKDT